MTSGQAFVTADISQVTMQNKWLADSGASHHMTHRREWLYNFEPIEVGQFGVIVGNNEVVYALGRGNVDVIATVNNQKVQHKLCNVLFVPDISKNLLSIGTAADNGIEFRLNMNSIKLVSNNKLLPVVLVYQIVSIQWILRQSLMLWQMYLQYQLMNRCGMNNLVMLIIKQFES